MQRGLVAKFTQHEALKNLLLGTNDAILIESSPVDKFWGSGWRMDSWKDDWKMENWEGKNKLGECIMIVREMIKNKCA